MSIETRIRSALAAHLDRAASTIHGADRLDEDLDLTALEVVLVALEVEDLEGVRIDVQDLEGIATVGELCAFLSGAVARQQAQESDVC